MGILGQRLVGVANIQLEKYCVEILGRLKSGITAFQGTVNPNEINLALEDKSKTLGGPTSELLSKFKNK